MQNQKIKVLSYLTLQMTLNTVMSEDDYLFAVHNRNSVWLILKVTLHAGCSFIVACGKSPRGTSYFGFLFLGGV